MQIDNPERGFSFKTDAPLDLRLNQASGKTAAERLLRLLAPGMILTVSGGTTVAAVAQAMPAGPQIPVRVLPARGGVGMAVETQAGTLAAEFARALGGTYSLVHLPDAVPPEALKELMKLPEIGEPLKALKLKQNVLIASITHGAQTEIPNGESCFRQGDSMVVVTSGRGVIRQINDIFQ